MHVNSGNAQVNLIFRLTGLIRSVFLLFLLKLKELIVWKDIFHRKTSEVKFNGQFLLSCNPCKSPLVEDIPLSGSYCFYLFYCIQVKDQLISISITQNVHINFIKVTLFY